MKGPNLRIPFAFEPGQPFDLFERLAFWDSPDAVHFFEEHGYTLYQRILSKHGEATPMSRPVLPFKEFAEASYPYAYYDSQSGGSNLKSLRTFERRGKVVFAQDSLGRHVAIKLVRDDTDEYRILRFLSHQGLEKLQDNCVIPVLDLLHIEDFWLVVMPRWGGSVRFPQANVLRDVLDLMHAMLKGLAFLHEHNISHGDINEENVLVNHFCDENVEMESAVREELRSRQCLSYAMFDFDFSIMLSPDVDKMEYRLPSERSWGSFALINDTAQGELDYNPFIFDVGNMGVVFCRFFQHLTIEAPFLAPLFDRMTSRDLRHRFTASQSLRFFEEMLSRLSPSELDARILRGSPAKDVEYDKFDRWQSVPTDFAKQWATYREPAIPWTTKSLRWLCRRPWGYHVVARIRWLFFRLGSLPRSIFTHFVGLRIFH